VYQVSTHIINNARNAPNARVAMLEQKYGTQPNARAAALKTLGCNDQLALLELTSDAAATPAEPSSLARALRRRRLAFLCSLQRVIVLPLLVGLECGYSFLEVVARLLEV
jgi:hypothetical protein